MTKPVPQISKISQSLQIKVITIYIKKAAMKILLMQGLEKGFIVRNFTLLYKRLFSRLELVTSKLHDNNFTVTPRLPFTIYITKLN